MIKAYTVRYDQVGSKTIDSHLKVEHKMIFNHKANEISGTAFSGDGFVGGIKATVVEVIDTPEEVEEQAGAVLEDANEQAALILEEARKEAGQIKKDAYEQGKAQGIEAGQIESDRKLQQLTKDLQQKEVELQEEYQSMVEQLEPQMIDMVTGLLEKIVGVIGKTQREVVGHLITNALKRLEKSNEYIIKVSKEDFEYVSSMKEVFLEEIGRDVAVFVKEMGDFKKNQCIIETDQTVINCSLDVQLNNLITQMKLLSIEI